MIPVKSNFIINIFQYCLYFSKGAQPKQVLKKAWEGVSVFPESSDRLEQVSKHKKIICSYQFSLKIVSVVSFCHAYVMIQAWFCRKIADPTR